MSSDIPTRPDLPNGSPEVERAIFHLRVTRVLDRQARDRGLSLVIRNCSGKEFCSEWR